MSFYAKVILDSVNKSMQRLTTMEVRYPRIIHSEFMTHRVFSRNAASSRAIPVKKLLSQVMDMPFIPEKFGINQTGMQSYEFLEGEQHQGAITVWLKARDNAHRVATTMSEELNIHKQLCNRLLEPFSWITVIVTATDWNNFFNLRIHEAAQGEINKIAGLIKNALDESIPNLLFQGQWHTPYIQPDEKDLNDDIKFKVSAARCARVSYLTHDGKRAIEKDLELFQRLIDDAHMSPHEHPARPIMPGEEHLQGNFRGWVQFRKTLPNETFEEIPYEGEYT
jgi:thymidylate synthase ThyX